MLNFVKVLRELNKTSKELLKDYHHEYNLAKKIWLRITNNPTFIYKVKNRKKDNLLVPSWEEPLGKSINIEYQKDSYNILSVDGSQIYPDKHQGISCFLINIGIAYFHYNFKNPQAHLDSMPSIYADYEKNFDLTSDLVDLKREELELSSALKYNSSEQFLFLFDGSLIFWHLDSKKKELRDKFLHSYMEKLEEFHKKNIPIAGYISLPRSKELINLVLLEHCNFDLNNCKINNIDKLLDIHIVGSFLKRGQRTILFKNNAKITESYPNHLKPYFFYINVGEEIGRVEIPAWMAKNINSVAKIILDQSKKGNGYPISLAEAHEQAVVKGSDRDMFFHLINKLGMKNKHKINISRKSFKKRTIGI